MISGDASPYRVEGAVTLANVQDTLDQGLALIRRGDAVLDLSSLGNVDSSVIAMMLAWLREARSLGRDLRFTAMPQNLSSLAELYGVLPLIPRS